MPNAPISADQAPQRRPFAAFLQEHRNGALHAELSDALADVVRAALEHGKAGLISFTLKVSPNRDGLTVVLADDVKVKVPQGARGEALYFADDHGNVSRNNPNQLELGALRTVPAPATAEARDIAAAGGAQ